MVWYLLSRQSRTVRLLAPLLLGIAIPFLPWLAYAAQDPQSFIAQFGGQLVRKTKGHLPRDFFLGSFLYLISQYASSGGRILDALFVLPLWLMGLVGLGDSALMSEPSDSPQRRSLTLLYGSQILIFFFVLWSGQIWYVLYVIPLTAIGVCHLLNTGRPVAPFSIGQAALTVLVFFCVFGFLITNMRHTWRLDYRQNAGCGPNADYTDWSSEISRRIPPGSRLLFCLTPDPYFGLKARPDLDFREYLPPVIPIDHDKYWGYMSRADYVIVGRASQSPSAEVEEFLRSNATLVDSVGEADCGYFARIYRIKKEGVNDH